MSLRKTLFFICLILSTVCLAAGYGLGRQWMGTIVAILLGPGWWLSLKRPGSALPFICLSLSVGLAAVGILTGSPPLWMVFGSAAALAVWDLLLLDAALRNISLALPNRQYESQHIRVLLLALGFALLAILLGRFVNIQLPFVVLLLFLALILFGLDRIFGYIKKTGRYDRP